MACFFVGGINRAGTTLLQSILCSDRTANPLIHEASYLRNIVEAYDSGRKKFEEHNKYYFSSIEEMKVFTARWAGAFIDRVPLIKYEDLVTDPAPVIETLRRASGLKLEEFDAAADWQHNEIRFPELKQAKNAWLSESWGKRLSNAHVGSYRTILTPEEIDLVEKVCTEIGRAS